MNPSRPSGPFSSFFTEEQFVTQAERIDRGSKNQKLVIGIPKEETMQEHRVALVPNAIRVLIGHGHRVLVESGAGIVSRYSDHDYSEAGAEITSDKKLVYEASVILKIQPPTKDELDLLTFNQLIISQLSLPLVCKVWLLKIQAKKATMIAMEYMQDERKGFPIVSTMSEISGLAAISTAAELLSNMQGGRGVLLGGVAGVPPTKVVILGANDIGEAATRAAMAMGAAVRIFDNDIYMLKEMQEKFGKMLHTSTINPVHLGYQLLSADVVIGALHSKTSRAPIVITEEMVMKMKKGAVIMDLSINQGGCIESSELTTHAHPTFTKHGIIHYCVPNVPSKFSRTGSIAISNILVPLLLDMGEAANQAQMLICNKSLRSGNYMYKGKLTNNYLSQRYDIKYTDLNLILTSDL